jgi:protease I
MELGLTGCRVAILAAGGVDDAQLGGARKPLVDAGAVADVVAARRGELAGARGGPVAADRALEESHAADYDVLVLPGGRGAAIELGQDGRALQLVREFMAGDKPVVAIGDGIKLLIAADAVAGRVIAAPREIADEVRAKGGEVVDAPVHVDEKLITGQGVGDLATLTSAIVRELAKRADEARVDQLSEQSFPASDPPPGPVAVGGEGASTTSHLDPHSAAGDRAPDRDARA